VNAQLNVPEEAGEIRLPRTFFSDFIPVISNLNELRLVLYVIYLIQEKGDILSGITATELSGNQVVKEMLSTDVRSAEDIVQVALESAVSTGILLHLPLGIAGKQEDVYFLNTNGSEEIVAGIQSGKLNPIGLLQNRQDNTNKEDINIFTLYEENIGMLTPMIAEQLKEAEQIYPASWIKDAFREAASLNKRSWRYIERILERWRQEGREHGSSGRYIKENDPDRYFKGKYGHIVQR